MTTEPSAARLSGNKQIVEHALGEVRTFIDELKNGTRKYKTIASLGGQIAEAYRGRCVLELLQNAHDALADTPGGEPGLVTFSLETAPDPVLLIANSGYAFERKDFKGLCQLGQSPKDPNRSVGNKGLGFQSVLEVTSGPRNLVAGDHRRGHSVRLPVRSCDLRRGSGSHSRAQRRRSLRSIAVLPIGASGRLEGGSARTLSRPPVERACGRSARG